MAGEELARIARPWLRDRDWAEPYCWRWIFGFRARSSSKDKLTLSQKHCYMKSVVSLLFLIACLGPRFALAQEQGKRPQSGAPTGTYAPQAHVTTNAWSWQTPAQTPDLTPPFTLQLETNGTYVAKTTYGVPTQDGDLVRLLPEVARGTWHWDAERREFWLEPGHFMYYIKCLPVDKQHTNRLVWGSSWLVREENE